MHAIYHSAAWNVVFVFTALCAPPQNPMPEFYQPCHHGSIGFYTLNGAVGSTQDIGIDPYIDPPREHLDFGVDAHMLAGLPTVDHEFLWLNGVTSLADKNEKAMRSALTRLRELRLWLIFLDSNLALPTPEWHQIAELSIELLGHCCNHLEERLNLPPPNLQIFQQELQVYCAQPPENIPLALIQFHSSSCLPGIVGYHDVHTFAYTLNLGGDNRNFQDDNLDFPFNVPILQGLDNHNVQLMQWLNRMTSQVSKTTAVIQSALLQLRMYMQWLNTAINNGPLPGAIFQNALPAVWRNTALHMNVLLVQCSNNLFRLIRQPSDITVMILVPEQNHVGPDLQNDVENVDPLLLNGLFEPEPQNVDHQLLNGHVEPDDQQNGDPEQQDDQQH